MKPQSGNWTVLTHSRGRGLVADLCWSRDGTRIFFDRYFDVPQGIFSVPALGGDGRLELDNAESPQTLPDGSLLVTRINAARMPQLHRFWLETGRLDPLPALIARATRVPAVRVFPDAREAVFLGRPSESSESPDALYAIDLASRRLRQLAPSAVFDNAIWGMPLAVTPDGQWVGFGARSEVCMGSSRWREAGPARFGRS